MGGPIRARRSRSSCAKPGSRRRAGRTPCMCRRSRVAGFCARRSPGSAPAPPSPCRSRACTSSRPRSRSIARSRRGARGGGSCLRSSPRSCLRRGASCYRRRSGSCAHRLCGEPAERSVAARRLVSALAAAALHVLQRSTVAAAPAVQREAVVLAGVAVLALLRALVRLMLLPAGDEGRQPIDVAVGGRVALRALMLLAVLMLRERLRIARDVRLRFARPVRRVGGTAHRGLPIVLAVVEAAFARSASFVLRTSQVRIVLPKLLLRRSDHAIIVFGVLVVILRRDRITRGQRVACKLNIFLCNVRWIAANLHIRTV